MESYVERYHREQKEAAQKKTQKEHKPRKGRKAVKENGTDTRSEGHEAQKETQ